MAATISLSLTGEFYSHAGRTCIASATRGRCDDAGAPRLLYGSNLRVFRQRSWRPPDGTLDVRFHLFISDELGTVERIDADVGLEFASEVRAEITTHRDGHRHGRDGQVVYDLRRDFDTNPNEVRMSFGFHLHPFNVRQEVR